MMTYEEFEKKCYRGLVRDRKSDDPQDLLKYLKEEDSQNIIHQFYDKGSARYIKSKNNEIAFDYCISTAVENLSLMY